jgi:conjugative relaxase-like TrwC/TraI family protein
MLRIHEVTSASHAKAYYAASDYYTEGQEVAGEFMGKLAAKLGLSGTVDKASFDALCDNLNPKTGKPLTPRTNDERRVGKDFVFSGPKSFSIVEALASEDERQCLLGAFNDAITETLVKDIEPDVQTRVRADGADEDRTTGNLLAACFDHSTARPVGDAAPDPHRHKHVLVFNATYDPVEQRIKAGQFGNIKRDAEYYTAAFYSRLAGKLEVMGYAIDRRGGKAWEIAGVPQSVIDKFSKRTEEVEAEHADRLLNDPDYKPGNKHELGAKTRSKKQKELTPDQLRKEWDGQLTDPERDALGAVYRKEIAKGPEVSQAQAAAFAIAHCSEQQSVVPERELKRVALLHGLGSVSPDQIAGELPRHGVLTAEFDGRVMATTKQLQAEEQGIIAFAAGGRGSVRPVGMADGLERGKLNDGQWETVVGLLNSENRVNLFEGPAGAGKSWSLQKFDEGMRLAGKSVTYLATSTDAVDVLKKEGFDANTVARFLLDEKMQNAAKGGYVVVDEASMFGHKDAARFFALADKLDLKVTLVGDPMQHGSVPRGALMRVLKEYAGLRPFRLTEIMRQENADYRGAAKKLSEGDTLGGFDALDRLEWVKEMSNPEERYRQIAADYLQALEDKKSVLVVSPTHAEAGKITREIRGVLREAGRLGAEDREFTRLVPVNASEAERGQKTTYRPGDVLQFHQNAKGFRKGERLTITDPGAVPVAEAAKFSLYRPQAVALASGDKIRFTATVKTCDGKHKLSNGSTQTIAGFTPGGDIQLDNGWVVASDAGHFRSGFVETSFGSQGRTVQRAILAIASDSLPATNQEQMYVSSSRAKERMTLYTDDKQAVRGAVQRSSQKLAATDLVVKERKIADHLRQLQARKRRLRLIDRVRAAWHAVQRRHQPERQQVSHAR